MAPSSNQFLSLPNELQTLIWKSYLTNTVFYELHDKVTVYTDTYPGYKLDARCGLSYHGFKPYQSNVSGQQKVHTDYGDAESDSEESEYSHDSWGEYAYNSSDDSD
jgi:hypothetical protein